MMMTAGAGRFSLPSLVLLLVSTPCSCFIVQAPKSSDSWLSSVGRHDQARRTGTHDSRYPFDGSSNQRSLPRQSPRNRVRLLSSYENEPSSVSHTNDSGLLMARRTVLCAPPTLLAAAALAIGSPPTANAAVPAVPKPSSSSKQSSSSSMAAALADPVITDKVHFNIRISRPDGSFYVRDDDVDAAEIDRVFYCRIVVGLFGQDVPNHVQRFLSYCIGTEQQLAASSAAGGSDAPSYASSMVTGMDPATGLLQAGVIPSLRVTLAVAGTTTALEYRGRLVPASVWLDAVPSKTSSSATSSTQQKQPLSHVGKGLLTHARLDLTPTFGITTRSDTRELDGSHQVFGRILFDESEGAYEFLERVRDLPTYSLERPISMDDEDDTPVDAIADAVFAAQRNFFRKLAKDVGDTRLDKVYPGKFLRRVEVTQVSKLVK